MSLDVYSLFIALLTTAILQEFIIRPSVEFLRKYYHKSKKHMGTLIFRKKEKQYIEPLMEK